MYKEERFIPGFILWEMLEKVVNKHMAEGHVLFEAPVYEKVNDELWFIYFTSQRPEHHSDHPLKIYYQVVMGFACIEQYYFNIDMIDADKNHSLDDLKERFRNHLKRLLRDSEEKVESL